MTVVFNYDKESGEIKVLSAVDVSVRELNRVDDTIGDYIKELDNLTDYIKPDDILIYDDFDELSFAENIDEDLDLSGSKCAIFHEGKIYEKKSLEYVLEEREKANG